MILLLRKDELLLEARVCTLKELGLSYLETLLTVSQTANYSYHYEESRSALVKDWS